MSMVEQGSEKAGAAKKNKIDTDNFDLGGETPIERMDIVLPSQEEIGAGLEHANQQPLESGLNAPASQSPGNNAPTGQKSNSNDQDTFADNAPASENTPNPDNNVEVQNTPSLDGVDLNSVQSGAGAPLAPELNEGSNTSNANQQSSASSGGGSTTPGGSDEVNVAPTDIVYDNSSVDENASGGTVIATLSTVDANDSDTHTYAIVSDPSGYFEIVGDEIRLKEGADLDFETAPLHEITIQATDSAGNSFTETMTIDLNDLNEHDVGAVTDTDSAANTIAENASAGDAIGVTASASDADGTNNTVTYSVDDARFEVASDGTVTVASGASFDAETEGSIDIEVTATSADGSTSTETFSINVSDIDEFDVGAVSDSNSTTNAVDEDASVGDTVGITALASDGDVTDGVTYSLSDDAGGLFDIDANTGVVTVAGSLDAETDTSHTIEVTATSDDGSTSTQTFAIGVNDVNETSITAISDTDASGNAVTEGASVGTAVGITALASDADATDTVSYSLSSNPGDFFAIDANTGEVTVAGSLDYETDTSHTIEVTATSSDGTTSTQTFTIAVGDEDEHDVSSISDTDTSANTITEDVSNGDSVGITASATDADGSNNTVTYSLSDDAGGIFEIDANTGEVSIADASGIDYEAATSHSIEVTATSADGSTSTQSYTINVTDVDEFDVGAVTDTDSAANTIAENASAGDAIGVTASATDADGTNNTVTYSVDDARFEVASDGTVTVASGASFDAETEGSIDIEVTATSADGSTSTETFSINVSDIDEFDVGAVSDSNSTTNAVDEDASVGDTVGITALASDGDATDGVTYSLSDDAGGLFDIDANTGVVTVAGSLDAETSTSHTIEVTATSDDGSTSTQTFAIGVNDINETSITAISDTDASGNAVTEGASVGTAVGITALASDADATDTVSYSLSSNPGGFFAIDANTGEVTVAGSLDYETDTSHTIEVTATSSDGTTSTQTFTIVVGDEDEHDVSSISDTDTSANTITEDVSNGDSVGITASATDADGSNNTVTYSLSDDAGGIFEIDANTGEVSIADASGIDYETATSHTIEVTATSADGSTSTQTMTVNVTDVDEFDVGAVTDTDSAANTIAENASAGDEVGVTASATDADGTNNTVTYSVDDARFEVASDGTVTVASGASFDAETEGSIDIEVTATSADGSTSTETFSINVSDIDEFDVGAISDSNSTTNAVDEDASVGDTVGITALASDGDVTDGVTYSLSDDAGGLFDIDANTGVVTVAGSLDAETSTSHTIEVTATSDDGSTSTQTFAIGVNDVNETSITAISDTDASGNTVTEGASVGTAVGITALASDADATDTVSYSLSSNPGGFFAIDANTGEVTVAGSLDYETDTSHTIEVTATSSDGTTSTQTFTIAVGDEDEHDVGSISDTDGSANTIAEDVSNGDSVGITASATDADGSNNTVTYSLSDDAGGIFEIDANTGEVSIADASGIDYETATSHTIEVTATSADGSTSTQSYTINVTDVDEFDVGAVADTDSAANTIAENASAGDEVGVTASATDADGTNNTVTYSVDDARFEVASDGTVTVASGASFDAETEGSIDIEVTATSADGSTSTETFSINVSDIDEFDIGAVSDSNTSSNGVDEDASEGDTVGITALASDGDVTDGVTYSLSDDAGGLFDIDANTGVVTVAGSLDAETSTSHTIEVTATSDDGSTSTQTFSIGVNDVNETSITAISDSDASGNTVTEGASVGTAVGITALASDADATDTVSYSLSSNPGGFFAIDANTGEVTVAGSLDYETDTSHTIEVTATSSDGTTSTQTFTIAVGDEDEHDVGSISDTDGSANTIAEDVSNGDSVGITASATDADGSNNTVTYTLSDDAGGIFEIDANTGEVSIADASGIDYEAATSHSIEVTATSADGSTSTQSYTINVTDVDEFDVGAVTDTDSAANTIAEDVSNGDSVGVTASATDADGSNNTVTYSLSDDASGIFEIDATTGEVSIADASGIDYETATSHTIEVTATSADGSTSTQSYTINVTDVDEFDVSAISDTDASTNSVDENAAAGTTVGIVASASDADATNSDVTYSLSDDAGGLFTIDASTGEVTTTAPLDAETASSYDIEVTATSQDGSTSTTTFTVDVNNLMDEGPTDITFTGGTVNETVADGGTIDSAYDPSGSTVATLSATDADSDDTFSFAITNDPSGHFEIVGNEVRVKSGQDIDFETAESHDITIEVTDAGGNIYSETITINVQDYEGNNAGTASDDNMTGTSEEDTISGGSGEDIIYGGDGDDVLDGGDHNDTIYGGAGNDRIEAGEDLNHGDDDTIYGGEGNDTITSVETDSRSNDTFYGEEGDDSITSMGGADLLDGGEGNDQLSGGTGDDRYIGGEGNDTIDGGDDTDTAVYSGSWSDYTITESDGTYTIVDNRDGSPDGTDTVTNVENFEFADGTVGVADLLDVGPSDIDVSSDSVDENSSTGSVVATLSATDNALDSHTYTITNDPSGFFEISGDQILVKAGADIDFENATSHDVTIEVTDANGNTYSETITIDVNDLDEFDVTAVSDTDTSANTIAEDVSNGDSVGITASATDADGSNNTVTYSLSDDAGGIFEIDASTGEVSIADASGIDYETATSHTIEVTATSADGSTSTQSYTINVTDVDEFDVGAVTDTDSAANTIAENASAGDEVGVTASATDADGTNNTVTYSVDDARFEVASDGTVTVASGASFDAETEGSIDIEVTATSADGSTSTETFSINVSDIDEFDIGAVSDSNTSSNGVDEDASEGDTVGITALASDGDVTDGVTYSLSDDAGGLFDIDANTGVVTVAGSLDAETSTSHTIEVTATSDDGSTSTQTFSIGVNDVNETSITAISDSDASGNTVTEGASVGTAVGITALASDADATDTVSYSLSSNPGGFFAIDANTGEVTVAGSLDYETDTSHTIEVTATSSDGTTSTQTFTIAVGDEDEHDVSSISDTNTSTNIISEGVSNGDSAGITASATDADGSNNTVTYSLSDDAGGIFEIDASTGEVSIADASGIDYETATSHTIEVTATSADGSTSTQNYTIDVSDVDEFDVSAVSDTDSAANTIAENASAGDEVGVTASASDADGTNNAVTYSLSDDAGGIFEIDANTGEVSIADASGIDYETATSHTIEVTATSADGSTSTETFSINVSDIDEFDIGAVSDSNASSNAVDENASVGDTVGITALASDGDVTDGVTYSLSDDAGGLFDIDANTGVVTVAGSLDAETSTSHTIEVTATSDDGSMSTQTFSIGVNDVSETSITAISDSDAPGNSVTEGASVGTAVGITAFASDADATDTVSYSLSSNPGGFFAIDANTGEVTVVGSLDYETDTSHTIEVTATSTDGTTSTQTFTIAVGDEDEHDVSSISDTNTSTNIISEGVSNGDSAGITASATDADGSNNTVTYSLSDDAGGIFEIDASTGEVSIADASGIDYEDATSHTIEVTATSVDGSTSTQSYTINVTDVDEFDVTAVSDTDSAANTIAENASAGDEVGVTASASDADGTNNAVSYSVDDTRFEVASDGTVTVASGASFDAETEGSIDIEVTATSADGSTSTETFSINVSDIDEFDVGAVSDTNAVTNGVDENAAAGTTVGIVASALDDDATKSDVTYSLSDAAGGLFTIDALTGEVTTTVPLDAETASSYDIEITATSQDGSTSTTTFTVDVNNLMDEGPTDITFTGGTVNETVADGGTIDSAYDPSGSTVATLSATDADAGDSFSYNITSDTSGHFEIVGNEVRVKSGQDIDFETAESHDITIEVTDAGGNTYSETITINIQDFEGILDRTGSGGVDDVITGTSEEDLIKGHGGNDTIYGGDGNDVLDGGESNDTIYGGAGDDIIEAGEEKQHGDDDTIYGGTGNDTITSVETDGRSNDTFYGEEGDDSITSMGGADLLDGGEGNDQLSGGTGDDRYIGGEGNDTIDGGDDTDTAVYSGSWSDYTITESDGTYTIVDNRDGSPDGTDAVTNVENFEFADGTVAVADLLDVGPSDIDVSSDSVDENSSAGTVVATLSATDNALDSHTYTITNDPSGFFEISGDQVLVKAGADLDTENAPSHDITIEVTDGNGNTYSETITINVADIDEFDVTAVSDTDSTANTIAEDVSNGDSVGITVSATDADGSDNAVTYSLSDDAGGIFDIDTNSGEVSIADASGIDYETATSHTIEVTATSEDGSTSTQSYTIDVTDVDEFDISAVTDTDSAANTIAENASAGDEVGVTALASDGDATNNTVTYSVDDARFDVAADGKVTVATGASFDAETESSIDIEVTATSADGSSSTETFSINISDIDEFDVGAVSDSNATSNAIDEDASIGDTVGITALATDGDLTDNVTYSLSDDAGGLFDIGANTGVVTVAGSLDAETDTSHTIEVTATSDDGSTSTQTFSIGINDVNETSITAISDSDGSADTVTEGASVGTAVGVTTLATDADASDTISYSLSSNPGDFFAIDANSGEVTVAGSLDYETDTSHTIEVTATSTDGTTSTETFTIAVSDEDEHDVSSISDTDTSANTIAEDVSNGDSVGITVSATDADGSDNAVTYSLSDDAGGIFDIDTNSGEVSIADASGIDYENVTSHTIEVTATSADGSTSTQSMTVNVSDVNEGPTGISFGGLAHEEDFEGGASGWSNNTTTDGGTFSEFLGRFGAEEGSEGAEKTFSTPDAASKTTFTMDVYELDSWDGRGDGGPNSGAESLVIEIASETIEIPLDRSWSNESSTGSSGSVSWSFTTTDTNSNKAFSGWNDQSHKLVIEVSNPDEAVTFKVSSTLDQSIWDESFGIDNFEVASYDSDGILLVSVNEDASAGTVVANLSTQDVDAGESFTYAITSDPSGNFEISGNQIVVKAGADIDYEDATSQDVTVEVTDAGGNTYSETATINIADVNEAPTDITFSGSGDLDIDAASEIIAAGSVIGSAEGVADVDTGDTFTYALTDDAGGKFEIDADTGEIKLVAEHDASSAYSDTVDVQVTDSGENTYTETVGIQLGTEEGETLTGTSNSDIMHGFGGQDALNGGDGDDILVAGGDALLDYSQVISSHDPIVHLRLSDTGLAAIDETANNHDGIYQGDSQSGAAGAIALNDDKSATFDGVGDYVEIPASSDFQVSEGTITMWFNTDTLGTTQCLISRDSSGYDSGGHLTIALDAAGQIDVRHQTSSNSEYLNSGSTTVNAGEWHQVAYTWGPDGMQLYVDDSLVGSNSAVMTLEGNNEPITIGANQHVSGDGVADNLRQYFSGQIDEVAMFDSALSASEIQMLNEVGTSEIGTVGDTLNGGDGDDILVSGAGNDTLDGGAGTDTVSYQASDSAVNVNLNTDLLSGGDAEGDTLSSIENVTGSDHNDTLTGDSAANILVGGAGDDTMYGGGESDIFVFGEGDGADTVYGDGGGWTDTIELSDAGGDLGTYGADWTSSIDSGAIDAQYSNSLTLSDDADGMVTLADDSTIDFYEIERLEF